MGKSGFLRGFTSGAAGVLFPDGSIPPAARAASLPPCPPGFSLRFSPSPDMQEYKRNADTKEERG